MFRRNLIIFVGSLFMVFFQSIMCTELIVMRHGQSEHNTTGVYNSNPEDPKHVVSNLTELGKVQARESAQKLLERGITQDTIKIAVVSPFPRTKQTAEILVEKGVIKKGNIIYDERLKEILIFDREGEVVADYEGRPWKGESFEDVTERVVEAYQEFKAKHSNIIFITHGIPGNMIINHITKIQSDRLKPGEVRVVKIDE